jgi:hypothetical protein
MNTTEITKKIDSEVLAVIGSGSILGFQKAHVVANAVGQLKELLTVDYMKPIMALQGNKLGFRTDKDKTGGYGMDVVKNCLIEAVLIGLQPTGNQFNIIAGNMYPTKEGCGYLLNNFPGLKYDLVCSLPRINNEKTGAAVDITIKWTLKGETNEKVIPIAIKMDQYTSVDAVIGKATRKGRAWLLSTISGVEITDGEVEDANAKVMSSKVNTKSAEEIEKDRTMLMINDCKTLEDLDLLQTSNPDIDVKLFDAKRKELGGK